MKVPRDIDASELIALLKRYGYIIVRQTGSHIRLSKNVNSIEHAITVPNHRPIKIGTLQSIAKDVCNINKIDVADFYHKL